MHNVVPHKAPISADDVLAAIGGEALQELYLALTEDGMAHVLRGSKPVFWLEETFTIIEGLLAAGFELKPDFLLVADSESNAFLVNRPKLLAHIEKNKNKYEELIFESQETSAIAILERLLAHFPDPYNAEASNQILLGGVLNYGFTNATIYARLLDPSVSEEEKEQIKSQQLEVVEPPQAAEMENEEHVIRPPSYCAWPNPESLELRDAQANDCRTIQASIAHIDENFALNATTEFVNDFMVRK